MIQSMTAFARESTTTDRGVLSVELRTVNHRYLDCGFKLPDPLRAMEPKFREAAGKALARGKFDCQFRLQSSDTEPQSMTIDNERLDALLAAADTVKTRLGEQGAAIDPLRVLQFPGIYGAPVSSEEALQKTALDLFSKALDSLRDNRRREGEQLAALILDRIDKVAVQVSQVREVMPTLLQHQRDRVARRIEELKVEVDQGRLEQELTYLSQKADVDEELDRLEAHVGEVRRTLEKGGPCGRRLDFLMQELNREANTLSSKSQSADTTQSAVELKVLIEQMREQVQNIE
jgi:uncharacterized protein (TIGR00255 family)